MTRRRLGNVGGDIEADIAIRNANASDEFSTKVGNRVFSGKGAREEAANALTAVILSWRDDHTMQPHGAFRGFQILIRGKSGGFGALQCDERILDLFVCGHATYSANLNASNPVGTVQSVEHTVRNLDRLALEQQNRVARIEKELVDYQSQADRPFEHEDRLKHLLARQAEVNSLLDLDKSDPQGAAPIPDKDDAELGRAVPAGSRSRDEVVKMAVENMRAVGTAIPEIPISERTPRHTGTVTGRAVARDDAHLAYETAAK